MGKLYKTQILGFTRLLPYYLILGIWTLSYFLIIKSNFKHVTQQKGQIESAVSGLINGNLLVAEFIEYINTNASATAWNKPMIEDIFDTLDQMKDINGFINQFRDDKGNLNAAQQKVFNGFSCQDFANYNFEKTGLLIESCYGQSQGTGVISYISLINQLSSIITTWYPEYQASTKTKDDLQRLFNSIAVEFQYLAILTSPMCTILYETARDKFDDQADATKRTGIIFSIITLVAILLGAIGVWQFVIKRLFRIEATDKDVLRMVPIRSILANQYLKQYLLQNSNRLLDNVKSLL